MDSTLRWCRQTFKISASSLAREMNIHRSLVSKWENGSVLIPDKRAVQLSHIFNINTACFQQNITVEIKNEIQNSYKKKFDNL